MLVFPCTGRPQQPGRHVWDTLNVKAIPARQGRWEKALAGHSFAAWSASRLKPDKGQEGK